MNYITVQVQLPLVRETERKQSVRTAADAAQICADLGQLAQESFHVVTLNARNRVINRHMVSLGIADASLVHPREVFRAVLAEPAAVSLILVHNHPSGDPTPSAEDVRITKQLVEAGEIIGIKVLDHVIVGRQEEGQPGFLSLREQGLCAFK